MVHQIIKSKHRVFTESLILTLLILLIGFALGFFVEFYRANDITQEYNGFEIEALDLKLQNYYYQIMDSASCDAAIQQNLEFADRIYLQGLKISKYEEAGELLEGNLLNEKKKYVLLKTELWLNSILLKEKCGESFSTVVYVYTQTPDISKKAEQDAVSNTLKILKEKHGNDIILIPIAGDLGLESVNLQLKVHNISYFPSIIIDEETTLEGFYNLKTIETYLN